VFWYDDPKLLWIYAKVYRQKLEQQNFMMWVQGIYFSQAIGAAISSENKYPDRPLSLFPTDKTIDAENADAEEISAQSQSVDDAIRAQTKRLDKVLASRNKQPKETVDKRL
jgi:hypothetical protein